MLAVGGHEVLPIKLPKISDATKRSFYGNVVKDENVKVLPSSRSVSESLFVISFPKFCFVIHSIIYFVRASSLLPLRRDSELIDITFIEVLTITVLL